MKKSLRLFIMILSMQGFSQDYNFRDYLLVGVDVAEDLTTIYLDPLNEGLMYALTGGWYNNASVKDRWELDISLVANGSFVPSDKLSREIDISGIENLRVLGGGDRVVIPTILGSSDSQVTFVATVDGEEYQFDAPTGIGLLSTNLLPSAFLQASMGLPANTEVSFRYFPKLNIDEASVGILGLGLKHELTRTISAWETLPVAISAFVAYTRLDAEYNFQANGFITGESQLVDGNIDTFLIELLASTKYPVWNVYGGLGFITGKSEYALLGTYVIETQNEPITFRDPFRVQSDVSGLRVSVGGRVDISRFSINLDYTFQGFNNLSLGLSYNLLKARP